MKLELISFPICPFVQRSVITLQEKGADYSVTYINLKEKPDWFLKISPLGKVPVLRVDDEHVIFESAVISEFCNEVTPGDLHPEDPIDKAHNRAWIAFGENLLFDQHRLFLAGDAQSFQETWEDNKTRLARIAEAYTGPLFNGERFSLVDAALAPLLMRYAIAARYVELPGYGDIPALDRWWQALADRPSVVSSVPEDLEDRLRAFFREKESYFGSHC